MSTRRGSSTQVASSVPFRNSGTSLREKTVQNILQELRSQTVYDPQYTTTVLNGSTLLDSTSSTMQFVTGTNTGHFFQLPDATTLFNGQSYIISNESTATLHIKDFTSNDLFEVLADSIAVIFLQNNGTSSGLWVGYVVSGFATGILSYNVTSSILFTTTSLTDTLITGFTVTPVAGRYAIWFNARMQSSSASATNNWVIYKNGLIIADSDRGARFGASSTDFGCSTQTVASVNGSEAIDIRVRRTNGTLSVYDRSVTLIRLGPEI